MSILSEYQHNRGHSKGTIRVYRSVLAAFLPRIIGVSDGCITSQGSVEAAACEHEALLAPKSRPVFRCALRAFLQAWGASTGQRVTVTFPDGRSHNRDASIKIHPISRLIRELVDVPMPIAHIFQARWKNVSKIGIDRAQIHVAGFLHFVPLSTAQGLCLWAGGGGPAAPDLPLIPVEPRSHTAMPTSELRLLAKRAANQITG